MSRLPNTVVHDDTGIITTMASHLSYPRPAVHLLFCCTSLWPIGLRNCMVVKHVGYGPSDQKAACVTITRTLKVAQHRETA